MSEPNSLYSSQSGQDKVLHERIFGNHKGVFCDVGAHDGLTFSNTAFFETVLGWTGICLEPNPAVFAQLVGNRTCVCLNEAAYYRDGTVSFLVNEGYTEMLSGIVETYDPRHRQRIAREQADHGGQGHITRIGARRLDAVLQEYGLDTVDYLSIDTEGSEWQVIQGIDFNRVRINVIGFEVNYAGSEAHRAIEQHLVANGFHEIGRIEADAIFMHSEPRFSWG
jgi:FkbM family methyltransferase